MAKAPQVPGLSAKTPTSESALLLIGARLADVCKYGEEVEDTGSEEAVHDMRVATRRLRAALQLFRSKRRSSPEKIIKRLQDALGGVRDAQIQLRHLRQEGSAAEVTFLRAQLKSELRQRSAELRQVLRRWRERDAVKVTLGLDSFRKGKLGGHRPRAHLRRRIQGLREQLKATLPDLEMGETHRLRIATKKLRYEVELLEPAFVEVSAQLRDLLAGLHDDLGSLHDLDMEIDNLSMVEAIDPELAMGNSLRAHLLAVRERQAEKVRRQLEKLRRERTLETVQARLRT